MVVRRSVDHANLAHEERKELDAELDKLIGSPTPESSSASTTETSSDAPPAYSNGHAHEKPTPVPLATGAAAALVKSDRVVIPAIIMIPVWIALSGCIIVMNKYIFTTLDFPFPVFVTAYHMLVATVGTRLLRRLPFKMFHSTVRMPWSTYSRTIVPLAFLFAGSLVLSNLAYVHLSISFVQMLKAFIPILTLVVQLLCGLQKYNRLLMAIIFMTTVGCLIAASGELRFSMFGFTCQVGAVIVESCRLVLIQVLLRDYALNPIESVALYAPLCAVLIGCAVPLMEGTAPLQAFSNVGWPLFIFNGLVSFSLNIAGVFLIDSAGSLVLTLAGIGKDVLLITSSVVFLGSVMTGRQVLGYGIALGGITIFKLTGGTTTSPLGSAIATHAASIFGFGGVSPGGSGLADPNPWRKTTFRLTGVVCALGFLAHLALNHESGGAYVPSAQTQLMRTIRYPVDPATVKVESYDHAFNHEHLHYSQNAPGLELIPAFDPAIDTRKLGRLAWVVIAKPGAIKRYSHELYTIQCHAERLGIPVFIEYADLVFGRHFFTARHRLVAKHLRFHQWVIATDVDMFVADSRRDPREFLDDTIDVIMGDRLDREICACLYFIRNSPGGWSFLRRWVAWDDHGDRLNYDNGDLNELIVAGLEPGAPNNEDATGRYIPAVRDEPVEGRCVNRWHGWGEYKELFLRDCIDVKLHDGRYGDDTMPYYDLDLWRWANTIPPSTIRIYKPFTGLFRIGPGFDHGGHQTTEAWPSLHLPGDFLVHGKDMGEMMPMASIMCTGEEWIAPEASMTIPEARELMRHFNQTWWPGCWEDGVNLCKRPQDTVPLELMLEGAER